MSPSPWLGRDRWIRFLTRSYQTLAPTHDGRIFDELTLSHTFDNAHNSAAAYIRSCETPVAAHHLVYDGPGMPLTTAPQLVPVNLVRLGRSPALTGHYMVDIPTTHDGQDPLEHFVASGRQTIPLTGHRDLEPGDILGTESHPLLHVPLEILTPHDTQHDVTTIAESLVTLAPPSTATNVTPDASDDPPTELLHRLDDVQRESFLRLWNTVPPHIRQIDFALLDAPGWEPSAIDALVAKLAEYADISSSFKLDYGACSLRPFEIKVPHGAQPIQSRPYRLNSVLSKQVDAILDSYLAAGRIQHSTSPWSSPLVCNPSKSGDIRITVNYQKLNKVTEIPQIAIPRVVEVLDTPGGGSVFSVFDLFSGFTQLTIHPDTIPLTAFCTPNGLYGWLRMPQGAAGAPAWFIFVMRLVTNGLDNIRMYLDDAIGSNDSPIAHVATFATFFARLRLHNLKLYPNKTRIGAARVDFLGHVISQDGVRPNNTKIAALVRMPMPRDIKQLRSLLGGLSYYPKFLPNMAKRVRPITALLKKGATFSFTSPMEEAVRALLAGLAAPPILVFPDWDAVIDKSRPFRLHCDASTDGLGATLEQEQPDGSIRPIVYISRATLANERSWTPMELEAGCVVWSIRRLRRYLFSVFFLIFTDHECLQQISKIGESKLRIQRWMEFFQPITTASHTGEDGIMPTLTSSPTSQSPLLRKTFRFLRLNGARYLGVYLIRACGYTTASCPTPGVGLGGLTASFYSPNTGQSSFTTPVLGGLPLTKDDFRTHRALMPLNRMTGPTASSFAIANDKPWLSYAINDHHEASRFNCARHTRSRTVTLTDNTPLRSDYRMAARSGFAASAAPSPPPKATLRSSPFSCSARLGSMIPLRCPTPPRMATTPNPQMDHSPPVAPPAQQDATLDDKTSTLAEQQLSNTLLSYSHSDWDKARRADPLCDVTRRYIQLGRPNPLPRPLCDHLPSHRRPEIDNITDLATKGRLLQGDHDSILLVRKPITNALTSETHNSCRSRGPFDDPVRIYVPHLARPWIMHACHANASCHLDVTRTLKMLERFYWWIDMEVCTKWWVRRFLK